MAGRAAQAPNMRLVFFPYGRSCGDLISVYLRCDHHDDVANFEFAVRCGADADRSVRPVRTAVLRHKFGFGAEFVGVRNFISREEVLANHDGLTISVVALSNDAAETRRLPPDQQDTFSMF